MATRRYGRARHEFRFGGRELVVLGAVFCMIASLVFAAGVVVGRETARGKGSARVEAGREPRLTDPDGLSGDGSAKTAATRAEEKVTVLPDADRSDAGPPSDREADDRGAARPEGGAFAAGGERRRAGASPGGRAASGYAGVPSGPAGAPDAEDPGGGA